MKRMKIAAILIVCLAVGSVAAEHSLGVHAGMVNQGYSYRLLSASGWGAEMILKGWYDLTDSTYSYGGEFRLLKRFNPESRVKIYLGLSGGYWQFEDYYTLEWHDDTGYYHTEQHLYDQTGLSVVGLVGVDLLVFEAGEKSGIYVSPEFQFGYYTFPNREDNVRLEESTDTLKAERSISPGAGIGVKYFF